MQILKAKRVTKLIFSSFWNIYHVCKCFTANFICATFSFLGGTAGRFFSFSLPLDDLRRQESRSRTKTKPTHQKYSEPLNVAWTSFMTCRHQKKHLSPKLHCSFSFSFLSFFLFHFSSLPVWSKYQHLNVTAADRTHNTDRHEADHLS